MEQLPLTISLKKVDGKLVITGVGSQVRYDQFVSSLEEGTVVEVTHEPVHGDVSYSQLSKIHKCIREVAKQTGHTFEEIKEEVKRKAGLYSTVEHLKSFAGITKDEASAAIQAVIEIAEFNGMNLENY